LASRARPRYRSSDVMDLSVKITARCLCQHRFLSLLSFSNDWFVCQFDQKLPVA
ncbi:Hypothetical predicted protein, partial [Paramuricea clavata]